MLVVFPLGLFFTATVFDIVTLMTGSSVSRTVAFYMILAGIIGGLAAAVPASWTTCRCADPRRSRPPGTWR